MAGEIIVPKLGLTETHATLVRWRKSVGEAVSAGDVVLEIQADKADVDIEADIDGVVVEILVEEGVEVELGTVVGRIGAAAAAAAGPAAGAAVPQAAPRQEVPLEEVSPDAPTHESVLGEESAPEVVAAAAGLVPGVAPAAAAAAVAAAAPPGLAAAAGGRAGRLPSSPLARRIAAELGVTIAALAGSGPGGLVVARDVRAAAAGPGAEPAAGAAALPVLEPASAPAALAPAASAAPSASLVPPGPLAAPAAAPARPPELAGAGALRELELSRIRTVTARRLAEAVAIPTVTLHRRARIEQARIAVAVARAQGVRATLTHAVLQACAVALGTFPELNGFWVDGRLWAAERINLGIAVDVEQGLLVAVAPDCGGKGIAEIAQVSNAAVADVRHGRGGRTAQPTFTVTNLGMLGVEHFAPLLNPPETGILGVGAVVDGRIGLSLTFDHRAIDGAPAARFLDAVARELSGG